MVKFNGILYVPQEVNSIMSVLRLVSKVATVRATKNNATVKKNGVSMTLDV